MGMEKLIKPTAEFNVRIEKLNNHNLDKYKSFLLDLILGKRASEAKRLAILDRMDAISKETETRELME